VNPLPTFWKRRAVRRIAIGGLLPLLLLAFLYAKEWKANHPPLTKADRVWRAALENAVEVGLDGDGGERPTLTGGNGIEGYIVTDKALIGRMAETLRISDESRTKAGFNNIYISLGVSDRHESYMLNWRWFVYGRDPKGAFVRTVPEHEIWNVVPTRFSERFEALVGEIARRAKAGDKGVRKTIFPRS
jgi:hypothetical protein